MYKVMIIDDDRTVRYILKRFKNWEGSGFSICGEAVDGKEAIKKMEKERYDLVITDIKMPGMDGIEFMQEVRRIHYDTCVIFLSTHSDFEYAKQGIRLGVFDYITKPIEDFSLVETLKRAKFHLDEKVSAEKHNEKEKNMITEELGVYFSAEREKLLSEKLLTYDKKFIDEAVKTFYDVTNFFDEDLFKSATILKIILERLACAIYKSYPWIERIEQINFDNLNNDEAEILDMKAAFLGYTEYIMDIVKKYELYQSDSMIKRICEYVLDHVEGDLKSEHIAEFVHIRSDYIGKLFRKKVGYNLSDYITKVKMEHAKYLIKTGKFKNYEITEKLGYSSPDYFCRLFKNYTGVTPAEFKK